MLSVQGFSREFYKAKLTVTVTHSTTEKGDKRIGKIKGNLISSDDNALCEIRLENGATVSCTTLEFPHHHGTGYDTGGSVRLIELPSIIDSILENNSDLVERFRGGYGELNNTSIETYFSYRNCGILNLQECKLDDGVVQVHSNDIRESMHIIISLRGFKKIN